MHNTTQQIGKTVIIIAGIIISCATIAPLSWGCESSGTWKQTYQPSDQSAYSSTYVVNSSSNLAHPWPTPYATLSEAQIAVCPQEAIDIEFVCNGYNGASEGTPSLETWWWTSATYFQVTQKSASCGTGTSCTYELKNIGRESSNVAFQSFYCTY